MMTSPLRALVLMLFAGSLAASELPPPGTDGPSQRAYQVAVLVKIAKPVLMSGADGTLKDRIPKIEGARNLYAPLEALGRTLAGISPWLELGPSDDPEGVLRARFIDLAVKSIAHAVDPESPGHLNFTDGGQPLVDTAFFAALAPALVSES